MADIKNETKKTLDKMINNGNEFNQNPLESLLGASTPFFNGLNDVYNHTMGSPLVNGPFYFIFFTRVPEHFNDDPDLKYFKRFFQLNFRGYDGWSEITMSPLEYTTGANGLKVNIPGDVNNSNDTCTTKFLEFTGSPGKRMIEKLLAFAGGESRVGITSLANIGKEWHPKNYTVDFIIMMVRKDFLNDKINPVEWAAYYPSYFPTNIPGETGISYSLGSQEVVESTIQWSGATAERGVAVERMANEILKKHIINPNSPYYVKFVDSMGANKDAINNIRDTDGFISEIFKKTEV